LLIMTLLAALPVIVAVLVLRLDRAPSVGEFEQVVLNTMLAGTITPLVVLAIAGAALANEVEDKTLANLTLAPLPRWKIVLPKLLAAVTLAGPFIAVSAFLTSYVAFLGDGIAVFAVTLSALVGVVLYTTVFVWLGLWTTQAIGMGLLYIVLWEGFFAGFVSGARLLSIRYYAITLMHGLDERRFAGIGHLSLATVLVIAVIVGAGFTGFAIRRLRRMDVP
jgi:ABC-2 type transport system permease protein